MAELRRDYLVQVGCKHGNWRTAWTGNYGTQEEDAKLVRDVYREELPADAVRLVRCTLEVIE